MSANSSKFILPSLSCRQECIRRKKEDIVSDCLVFIEAVQLLQKRFMQAHSIFISQAYSSPLYKTTKFTDSYNVWLEHRLIYQLFLYQSHNSKNAKRNKGLSLSADTTASNTTIHTKNLGFKKKKTCVKRE